MAKVKASHPVMIYPPHPVYEKLQRLAEEHCTTVSALCMNAVIEFVLRASSR